MPILDQYLRSWISERLNANGYFDVNVQYNSQDVTLPLLVNEVKGK